MRGGSEDDEDEDFIHEVGVGSPSEQNDAYTQQHSPQASPKRRSSQSMQPSFESGSANVANLPMLREHAQPEQPKRQPEQPQPPPPLQQQQHRHLSHRLHYIVVSVESKAA